MREFRVWDKQERRMIYADEAKQSARLLAIGLHGLPIAIDRDSFRDGEVIGWNVDHAIILMEWIGEVDRTGKKIFARDIVQGPSYVWVGPHVIEWPDDLYEFREYGITSADLEILGNICEHPDLLTEQEPK